MMARLTTSLTMVWAMTLPHIDGEGKRRSNSFVASMRAWRRVRHVIGETQGCQMVCFQTKNPNLGKILEGLEMENLGIF
jgi:hypothetical protein